ncbi:MAG: GntR family transcriptional regulator [Chloroflexi bacterium]|nr:GntR family transcriptional regulator [Chloroflexota bacterium]
MELGKVLPEQVADRIRTGIIDRRFLPGERLTESALVKWLNISNSPIREALNLLEKEGLVVKEPRRGAYVRRFTEEDIRQLYLVRSALDDVAYKLLIEDKALEDGLPDRLAREIELHEAAAAAGDHAACVEHDLRFHDLIFEAVGTDVLISVWTILRAQFRVLLHWRKWGIAPHSGYAGFPPMHHAILNALRQRDLATLMAHSERRSEENTQELSRVLRETISG